MLPDSELQDVKITDYLKIFKKRLPLILAFLIFIPLAVFIYDSGITPAYIATTSVAIEKEASLNLNRFETLFQEGTPGDFYQTQWRIITSYDLVKQVCDELQIAKYADFRKISDPAQILRLKIDVNIPKGGGLVSINVEDNNPKRAADIANAIARAYVKQDAEKKKKTVEQAMKLFDLQLTDLKERISKSEAALNKFLQDNKITTPDIKAVEQSVRTLKDDKFKTESRIKEASARYRPKHPEMIQMNAQLEELNSKIHAETRNLFVLSRKMGQYTILLKDIDLNQQLYSTVLARAKEVDVVARTLKESSIRIVDPAVPPPSPFKPKKGKDFFLAFALSIFLGMGASFLLEYLDTTIHTADNVTAYVNLPFLGYLPTAPQQFDTEGKRSMICYQKPDCLISDSFRALCTSVIFVSPEDKPLKSLLITSSLPGEGKSFAAINLALVFAHLGEKTILIDANMHSPKIAKAFNLDAKGGLSDFLTNASLDLLKVIKSSLIKNLSVITAGTTPFNPVEALSSKKLEPALVELRSKFDRIIIDSPAAISAQEVFLLAGAADGIILLIKGAQTRLEMILKARDMLTGVKGNIIGAVINNIDPKKEDSYYYYHYYYSQQKEGSA